MSNSLHGYDCIDHQKLALAASVFLHTRNGVMITALDGSILAANRAFTAITGYSEGDRDVTLRFVKRLKFTFFPLAGPFVVEFDPLRLASLAKNSKQISDDKNMAALAGSSTSTNADGSKRALGKVGAKLPAPIPFADWIPHPLKTMYPSADVKIGATTSSASAPDKRNTFTEGFL